MAIQRQPPDFTPVSAVWIQDTGGTYASIMVTRGYGSTSRPRALAGGMGVWVGSAAACVRCNNVCGQTSKHIAQQQYSSRSPLNMFTTVQRLLTAGRVTKLVDARDDRELAPRRKEVRAVLRVV